MENSSGANCPKRKQREMLRKYINGQPCGDSAVVVREVAAYLSEKATCGIVALFAALPGEVDLSSLPGVIRRIWVFPKVVGDDLVFHEVRNFPADLEKGAYGIMEPRDGLREVGIGEVDVFLCPGLGFDLQGGRIGRGKGFYDRMLARARPDALKVGVCFSHQLVDEIVMDAHDVRMDVVIAG